MEVFYVILCIVYLAVRGVHPGSTERAIGDTPRQWKVIIGFYTGTDVEWMETLSTCWEEYAWNEQILPPNLNFTPFYIENPFALTYKDISEARKWLRTAQISVLIGPENHALRVAAADVEVPYVIVSRPLTSSEILPQAGWELYMWPSPRALYRAVLDVVGAYGWTQVAVLYDQDEGTRVSLPLERNYIVYSLAKQEFELALQLIGGLMSTGQPLVVRSWRLPADNSRVEMRSQLLTIRALQMRQIVLLADNGTVGDVLDEALRLSMLSVHYNWILADPRSCDLDLSPYNYTQVNLTALHVGPLPSDSPNSSLPHHLLQTRLVTDAISLVLRASASYATQSRLQPCQLRLCPDGILTGAGLQPYLQTETFAGMTGTVLFDQDQKWRSNVSLEVLSLTEKGLKRLGDWVSSGTSLSERLTVDGESGLEVRRSQFTGTYPLGKKRLDIVLMVDPPFVMKRRDYLKRTGNDRYEGFLIDLIEEISQQLKFQYDLYESPDGNYGSKRNGEWNGMIRELIVGNASMCLGAISITSERENAVDFTKPFMQKTFNILIKKPLEKTSPFQFLWPLSMDIWICTLTVMLVVSVLLFAIDKFSPSYEQTRFTLSESVWFIYGSLVGAGGDMFPRTVSGRLLSAAWWFFSLMLVSSYTANLAAFLTVTRIETPIKSIVDLASQTQIKYGTVKDTYAHSLFRNSKIEIIQKMWNFMSDLNPDSMVDNTTEGIEKVKKGDYAFIWDSPINKFTAMYECDTMVVGEPFDEKGLGIGVPLGAPYRDDITMAILSLQEIGKTQTLIDRWWGSGTCTAFQESTTSRTKELDMPNIAGVFLVLAGGVVVALLACAAEMTRGRLKDRKRRKQKPLGDAEQVRVSDC